jgi:SAM-dependent methyltransferase
MCPPAMTAGTPQTLEELLAEQLEYYGQRADEYHLLFAGALEDPIGPLGRDGPIGRRLGELAAGRDVLELAAGTGHWSEMLAEHAASLTCVDASPEMLRVHAKRVGAANVRRVEADAFAWEPDRRYELAFFGFWLSHVPDERMADFWELVDRALVPDGTAAFVDTGPRERSHSRPLEGLPAPAELRRLQDGREFRIVKVRRDAAELAEVLGRHGWRAEVADFGPFFLFGTAVRG